MICVLWIQNIWKQKNHNFKIIYIFQVAIAFVVTGILALVFSDRISGDLLIDEEGHIENGDKYAIIGGLAGVTSILAGIILAIITGDWGFYRSSNVVEEK